MVLTEIKTNVTVKKNDGEIVSADVNLYNDAGNVVKRISIVDSDVLDGLEERIDSFDGITLEELIPILQNANESTVINATKLNGLQSDNFATNNHNHSNYAPVKHDSSSNNYGVGSTSNYGHVKTVNNLNTVSYISGESLSAYQGALLNNKVNSAQFEIDNLKQKEENNSLRLVVGRSNDRQGEEFSRLEINSGDSIYVRIVCDKNITLNNREISFVINGVVYEKNTDVNGEIEIPIRLGSGKTLFTAIIGGFDGMKQTSVNKIVKVL